MKVASSILLVLAVCSFGWGQENAAVLDLSAEPHHQLLLENEQTRVFRLELRPNEASLPHHHGTAYAYLSLGQATIANEVRGRQPVVVNLDGGDVHTSKGGFTLAERNQSSAPADFIVVEALKREGVAFADPMGALKFHDAAFGELFELPMFRGYIMTFAAGGRTERYQEKYDRLVIAVTDLRLRDDIVGQPSSVLTMNAGDVQWFARGTVHTTTNSGTLPAKFVTLEFP